MRDCRRRPGRREQGKSLRLGEGILESASSILGGGAYINFMMEEAKIASGDVRQKL